MPDEEIPPQYLIDMRIVYGNHQPIGAAQLKLAEMWRTKPELFLAKLMAAEKDYRGKGVPAEKAEVSEDPNTDVIKGLLREEWALVERFDATAGSGTKPEIPGLAVEARGPEQADP